MHSRDPVRGLLCIISFSSPSSPSSEVVCMSLFYRWDDWGLRTVKTEHRVTWLDVGGIPPSPSASGVKCSLNADLAASGLCIWSFARGFGKTSWKTKWGKEKEKMSFIFWASVLYTRYFFTLHFIEFSEQCCMIRIRSIIYRDWHFSVVTGFVRSRADMDLSLSPSRGIFSPRC